MKMPLVDQPDNNPTRKTTATVFAGSLLTIVLWYLQAYHDVQMDAAAQGAFHTIIGLIAAWFVKDRMNT